MTIYSKFFNKLFNEYDIKNGNLICMPYSSVWDALSNRGLGAFFGSCQFYLPVYLVSILMEFMSFSIQDLDLFCQLPLLANGTNLNREKCLDTLRNYVDSVWVTFFTAISSYIMSFYIQWVNSKKYFHFRVIDISLIRSKITGKYTYWRMLQIPTMIGGHWMYVCQNKKVHLMFGHTLAVIVSELKEATVPLNSEY